MPSDLKLAAQALVDKLDAIDEPVTGVFAFAAAHGYKYTGPDYAKELVNLRAALSREAQSRDEVVELRAVEDKIEACRKRAWADGLPDKAWGLNDALEIVNDAIRAALSKSKQNP